MERIKIDQIAMDRSTQSRKIKVSTINHYAALMKDGVEFPPVKLFFDEESYWLADGFHRVEAARKAGLDTIRVNVQKGGLRDAILYSLGPANSTHGLPLSRQERRERVAKLLRDPEWSQWSDRMIARYCGVTNPTVGKIRREMGKFLASRKAADGRVMNISNIGQSQGGIISNLLNSSPEIKASFDLILAYAEGNRDAGMDLIAHIEAVTHWLDICTKSILFEVKCAVEQAEKEDLNATDQN